MEAVKGSSGSGSDPCPACGAPLGGRAGCQAAFDGLVALAWSSPARGAVHNLVVDAYSMQHPEEYGRSAKSYAAHLTALCCGVESGGEPELYWSVARWLDGAAAPSKPALLASRGLLTVANVQGARDDADHAEGVRAWARSVWDAYAPQQELARGWLRAAAAKADSRQGR